jgi:hypothetical protein
VHENALDFILLGHFQQRMEMSLIGMHSAVRKQAEEMKLAAAARALHGVKQNGLVEEFAILDHQLDAGRIHVDDAPGANVQVPDLAVAHLIVRKPNILTAGVNQRIGILTQQAVVNRLASEGDGVGFGFGAVSPAIEDD